MDSKKRVAMNMIIQMLTFIVNLAINFYLTRYVTEHVGKEVYGFVSLAYQTINYVTIFTIGLNTMLNRYITISLANKDYDAAKRYFSSVIVANAVVTLILLLPSILCVFYLEYFLKVPSANLADVKLLWVFIFTNFLVSLVTNPYSVGAYAANRLDISGRINMENVIMKAFILIGCFTCFAPKVWYVGMAHFVCGLWITVANAYNTRKLVPELRFSKSSVHKKSVFELMRVGVWSSVQQMSTILINGCDMLLTNIYIDAASMTLMGFAKTIPSYIMTIIGIVSDSFSPQMTIIYAKGDMDEFVKYVKSAIKVCGFICSVPILGFIAFGYDFLGLWLRVLTDKEVWTVQILSIMILAQTIFDVYIMPLYTVNTITCKLKVSVLVSLGIGVANIVGSIVLCKYTNLGVYAIQLVSSVLLTARVFFFAPIYAAKILKQKWWTFYEPLLRGMFSSTIILVAFALFRMVVPSNTWFLLAISAVACGLIGYGINYLIVLNKEERVMVKAMIQNRLLRKNNRIVE
ncbi:lipopolysaccharide biosynthesis protein [Anaerosporobacter sp.]